MSYPIQVVFLLMQHSDAVESVARKYAEKLARYYSRISSVKITIEMPHKKHSSGNTFQVKVDVAVPGTTICAATNPDSHLEYRDVNVALRDAFLSTRRQLEDYAKRRLDLVKRQAEQAALHEREVLDSEAELEQFEPPPYDQQDAALQYESGDYA